MRRAVGLLLSLLLAGSLASCGDPVDRGSEPQVNDQDLEAVVKEFGIAIIKGDIPRLLEFVEPSVRQKISPDDRATLKELSGPSAQVKIEDFAYKVSRKGPASADVVYMGRRCAPQLSYRTYSSHGSEDGSTDPTSITPRGTVIEGKVSCRDIRKAYKVLSPVKFVKVDGRWYGKLPGS